MKNCPFCNPDQSLIIAEPSQYPNWQILYNRHPALFGHLLLTPKKHKTDIQTLDAWEWHQFVKICQLGMASIRHMLGKKVTVDIVGGIRKVASQTIPHLHFHLFPRFERDGLVGLRELKEKKLCHSKRIGPEKLVDALYIEFYRTLKLLIKERRTDAYNIFYEAYLPLQATANWLHLLDRNFNDKPPFCYRTVAKGNVPYSQVQKEAGQFRDIFEKNF